MSTSSGAGSGWAFTHATSGGRLLRTPTHRSGPTGRYVLRVGVANLSGWSTYDVGAPTAAWGTYAAGADPADAALTYKVCGWEYENALVLYKPLSYTRGRTGTTADATATTHQLNGSYRKVNADGTLGPVVTQVTLRNGEGAVLVKA